MPYYNIVVSIFFSIIPIESHKMLLSNAVSVIRGLQTFNPSIVLDEPRTLLDAAGIHAVSISKACRGLKGELEKEYGLDSAPTH